MRQHHYKHSHYYSPKRRDSFAYHNSCASDYLTSDWRQVHLQTNLRPIFPNSVHKNWWTFCISYRPSQLPIRSHIVTKALAIHFPLNSCIVRTRKQSCATFFRKNLLHVWILVQLSATTDHHWTFRYIRQTPPPLARTTRLPLVTVPSTLPWSSKFIILRLPTHSN